VILSGHQAQVWHPGILAKVIAMDAAARAAGANAAWLVVDQDDNDPWALRFPVRTAGGALAARTWRPAGEAGARAEHVPTSRRPAAAPAPLPTLAEGETYALPSVREGLEHTRAALAAHADTPNAAVQVARAVNDLLAPIVAPPPLLFATAISATDLFAEIVERMRRDPRRAVEAYNAAARAHPSARVAELRGGDDPELPLWRLAPGPGSPRTHVRQASRIANVPARELAPRALLMTGLLRWAGCDLFVHGTGGAGGAGDADHEGYDAITDAWLADWLGPDLGEGLAPVALATATLRLPLGDDLPDPADIDRARWLAHRARHDPALLGDAPAASLKADLVARTDAARRRRDRAEARRLYRELHALLETARTGHPAALADLESRAAESAAARHAAALAADRTWPFPLHPAEALRALARSINT
jgi:hypothetical protein